ncbi:MAG: hypothetical protein COB67_10885 [SAR324 cluster bacterium]|uniref:Histidinol-phosphatase n=1 Tax=SAR324 cluster bacterium TaxID=2024889 RepID=A0A2A4SVZ2_9DELT|nr:MAG: hypothetical protein COB67_10885 [SAR324 cluster bacterium]
MKKWDGHSHTELCRHGSREKTALMVEKAIAEGFTHYSITEHAPLPDGLLQDQKLQLECSLTIDELAEYFQLVGDLKRIYGRKITILMGLEVDFLSDHLDFTNDLIQSCRSHLDEWILSLHFLKGQGGVRCLDYSPQDFQEGLVDFYGSIEAVHLAYWEEIKKMVVVDYQAPPSRLGHLGLIWKFGKIFPLQNISLNSIAFFEALFRKISQRKLSLDFDVAGMAKDTCGQIYLTEPMLHWCKQFNIPLVYGSDAHGIRAVGHYYQLFIDRINQIEPAQ